jgi:hypothetical protein
MQNNRALSAKNVSQISNEENTKPALLIKISSQYLSHSEALCLNLH